jgi:hypothetical protein
MQKDVNNNPNIPDNSVKIWFIANLCGISIWILFWAYLLGERLYIDSSLNTRDMFVRTQKAQSVYSFLNSDIFLMLMIVPIFVANLSLALNKKENRKAVAFSAVGSLIMPVLLIVEMIIIWATFGDTWMFNNNIFKVVGLVGVLVGIAALVFSIVKWNENKKTNPHYK